MNYGYSNNCSCGSYYSNNDCDCNTSCGESLCATENNSGTACGGNNCGILLFIIAVILIFWK